MLIRIATLKQIQSGEVTLAFRKWKRPTVKSGGTLKTAVGVLQINDVQKVSLKQITTRDAQAAGYATRKELLDELQTRAGDLYKISLAFQGTDPRIELRNQDRLTDQEFSEAIEVLQRMDSKSRSGPWTRQYLELIEESPCTLAGELALSIGIEKVSFKSNVRKLKNLGLTVSQSVGYTLSPRGVAVLKRLRKGE